MIMQTIEMKRFTVEIPISGYVSVEVEAENEKEAIKIALQHEVSNDNLVEWETHKRICEGNVCYAMRNGIDVYEEE